MITIYKDEKFIKSKDKDRYVEWVDFYFTDNFVNKITLNEQDLQYMKLIDGAEYLENNEMVTMFGKTTIANLSSGCKTLLILNHSEELGNPIVDTDCCGENVMAIICKMKDISIVQSFFFLPEDHSELKNIQVKVVNTRETIRTFEWLFSRDW